MIASGLLFQFGFALLIGVALMAVCSLVVALVHFLLTLGDD